MDKVTILYKSGNKVQIEVSFITAKWDQNTSEITSLEWGNSDTSPLVAGIKNIEAIYNGWV